MEGTELVRAPQRNRSTGCMRTSVQRDRQEIYYEELTDVAVRAGRPAVCGAARQAGRSSRS